MKKFNKYLLKLSLLIGLNTVGMAHAQFWSLHQSPVVFNISSSLDASGNLVYNKTNQLFGFKDQFDPTGTGTTAGVTACLIGYPEFRNKCQTINGGLSFILDGYTSNQQFKVYVPAGTTFFGVSGYLPQSVQYGVAVKLGSAPTRDTPLTEAEYQAAKMVQNRYQDFQRLVNGEERIIVHDGGGAISLSGIARLATPFPTGQWMYFRVLTANTSIAGLGAIYEVDLDQYRSGYNSLAFGANGDPLDNGSTPNIPDAAQIKDSAPSEDAAGNLVLNFKLARPASQVVSSNKTNFWVAARVSADGFFFTEDEWFFLTPNGWTQLSLPNPNLVAYQANQVPVAEKSFNISLDLPAADLGYFNTSIHFGYMGVDGVFKNMGVVWQRAN